MEAEYEALAVARKCGVRDVELMMLRRYEQSLKVNNKIDMADVKTALMVLRYLFPELRA